MTYPRIRLYGWVDGSKDGKARFGTWTDSREPNPTTYKEWVERRRPDVMILGYQIEPPAGTLLQEDKIIAREAWARGNFFAPVDPKTGQYCPIREKKVLEMRRIAALPDSGVVEKSVVVGPRGKPKTEIVQSWAARMEETSPGEIARRAWEATQALVKGGG